MKNQFKKHNIDIDEYYAHILKELKKGISITSSAGGRTNSMTISWGMLGIQWNKPIFTAFIRTGRFTHKLLEQNPQFTINIPTDNRPAKILSYLGSRSGHDEDKTDILGLHLVEGENIDVPGIAELPLTLECNVIYKQLQQRELFLNNNRIVEQLYPQNIPSQFSGNNCDFHTAFYGEIVGAYIIKSL